MNVLGKDRELMAEVDRQAEILDPGHIQRVTDADGMLSPADASSGPSSGEPLSMRSAWRRRGATDNEDRETAGLDARQRTADE